MYEYLRNLRKLNGDTYENLATLLGFKTRGAYYKKERGIVPFTLNEAKIVADYYNMGVDEIFFKNEVS